MKKYIYADNAATTKLDYDAFEAMKPYMFEDYGNVSQPYSFVRILQFVDLIKNIVCDRIKLNIISYLFLRNEFLYKNFNISIYLY